MTTFSRSRFSALLIAGTMLASLSVEPLQAQGVKIPGNPSAKSKAKPRPKRPRTSYMGRPIAQVMGFEGAEWLVRPERESEERPEDMLDSLKLTPGMNVADVGAGVGYTSLRLAKRIAPKGKVYATDLQPEMLRMLSANARDAGVDNIVPIRATQLDTKLPLDTIDLAIMVDVYHESSEPEALLDGIRKALKKDGRLVLVEFRAEDPEVPIKPEHKMSLAQVRKEVEPRGFTFVESIEILPMQHIIIFDRGKDKEALADPNKKPAAAKAEGSK